MIVIFVKSNVITIYNLVGIFEVLFYFILFFNLKDSGLSHRNTWGPRRVYITVTKVLSAEDDSMLYPFLPYAIVKDTPATISSCSASMD